MSLVRIAPTVAGNVSCGSDNGGYSWSIPLWLKDADRGLRSGLNQFATAEQLLRWPTIVAARSGSGSATLRARTALVETAHPSHHDQRLTFGGVAVCVVVIAWRYHAHRSKCQKVNPSTMPAALPN